MMRFFFLILISLGLTGCGDDYSIKPIGQLRLEYPESKYKNSDFPCPYSFEYSSFSIRKETENPCWYVLNYPEMKANIYLTYYSINSRDDLADKIKDSEKIVHNQTVKASYISPREFIFDKHKVYGTLFELGGESAVNIQFHATDSLNNLLTGSVYFSAPPQYDSLQPAIQYLKKDVVHLIETLRWK
ncbi:MAG: gliding motility lipoprotein GldD [Weeksellaceae bacterium]|nr:gliding motility lipoprotein GldD [Weeksellaceae bacterium]